MQGKPLYSISCKYLLSEFLLVCNPSNADLAVVVLLSLMNEVVHTSPTIGSNVEEIVVKNTHFLMWDIGGQESLRSSWNTYYSNTEVRSTHSAFHHNLTNWFFNIILSSSHFLPEHGSWSVCSKHRRWQGPPKSEVIVSQRSLSAQQSWDRPPLCLEKGEVKK